MSNLPPYDQKPPEYISGVTNFLGREFIVNPDVLIPRIETEEIISIVLHHSGRLHRKCVQNLLSVADIGTGSGCLGLTLFLELQNCQVYLSDNSDKALNVAKANLKKLVPNYKIAPVEIFNSDLFSNYPPDLKFDIVVSNLPYIPTVRIQDLPGSVKNFEPRLALDGGPEGSTIINRLLEQLPQHLSANGVAILEIDDTHTLKSFSIPKNLKAGIKKDQFGRNRFLLLEFR